MASWDDRFLELAEQISGWSKDASTQVGAVIVDPLRRVVATGFNGLPRAMPDRAEYYNDRAEKLSRIIHAEMNAILFAKQSLEACTLYTFPFIPCDRCIVHVIQTGIERIVAPVPNKAYARWELSFNKTRRYAAECGIEVVEVG